jgi:hypothetical protein
MLCKINNFFIYSYKLCATIIKREEICELWSYLKTSIRYDFMMMFKIIILQRFYNLSDVQVAYQFNDRMSFMRLLNLSIADDIFDSKTVNWKIRT